MLHASTKKLIDRLAEMTDLAKLDWTEGDDGNIAYATEGYSVSLTETPNEMVITSKDGKELERAGAEELANTPAEAGGTYADIVAAMTKEAARVARGTEAAISTLLAGMEDAPAEPDVSATEAPTDDAVDLQEDPGDETAVLTDDSVEAVSSETEKSEESAPETNEEPEIAALAETSESPETQAETEPEIEVSSEQTEDTELDTDRTDELEASEEVELEASVEPDAEDAASESEDDVTEAVVRLADEVNQREDNGLDAAAASAVGAVALAAGLTSDSEESESEAVEPEQTETDPVPAFVAVDETPTETPAYVPFGLEDTAESEVAVETPAMEASLEIAAEEAPESAEMLSFSSTPNDAPEEAELTPEPVTDSEPALAWGTPHATAEETVDTVEDAIEETFGEVETVDAAEIEADIPSVAMATAPVEETVEPAPAEEVIEPVAEAPQPAPSQTYSLSGIGAGFGLGALSAKSEASGIPGPSSFGAADEDKVVIDATEDVLPEIDGKPALPAGVAPIPPAAPAEGAAAAETATEAEDGETDILKPRTRFNPWD
ncbi:MAG: hypothetical protein Hens2KO_04960 [Henriciella sp.]